MKNISFIYTSDQQLIDLVRVNELSREEEYLVRIHTCIHDTTTIQPFVARILCQLPKAKIIGSSTSGVIFGGELLTNCCVVAITSFEHAEIHTMLTEMQEGMTGTELADAVLEHVVTESSKLMLTFTSHAFMKAEEFVDRLNDGAPHLHMIGGVANSPRDPLANLENGDSFVFNENSVSQNAVGCAVVNSNKLSVYGDIVYVTEPVGGVHTITEADGSIIRTIDGENAVDWYEHMLGVSLEDGSNGDEIPVTFPLVKPAKGDFPWAFYYSPQNMRKRVFSDEPEPVMFVLNEAHTGEKIRIAYSSIQKTIATCEGVCERLHQHPAEVLFGYSCASRQDMFCNCAKWELLPFRKTNLCGAVVAGEFGNYENKNLYCNYSFTIAAISENDGRVHLDTEALKNHAGDLVDTQEAVTRYLLQNTADDNLAAARQQTEIKESLFLDHDTGLGNVTKFQFDYSLHLFDKICMITIRNEGLLKAFLSAKTFDADFRRYHRTITSYLNDSRFSCYIYKESALLLTAGLEISEDAFQKKMLALQNVLLEFKFSTYVPVCEFALVMNEEGPLKKAELTLTRMRSRKDLFMVYTPELGLEELNVQKMKMVMIINDAITHNRVIPFYQGIRDNETGEINLYESLMRLEDENGKIYSPYAFLDIAREYGYYPDLSYMMIKKVLETFRNRTESVTLNMNINDVYNYKIVHMILKFLRSAPHPENYIFELTETEEIEDYQVIREFADKIHEVGGKIAIDDFGSGFSNIVNVFKIESDLIKIDGEIIRNISSDSYALEFMEIIAQWANRHNKKVVAEFVESNEIQELVAQNQIRYSQGYLYSKPNRIFA